MNSYVVRNESGKEFNVDETKISDAEKDGFLPVVSNGKESHRVSFDDMKLANKDGFSPLMPQSPQKEQGIGERIVRGGLRTLPAIGAVGAGFLATPETLGLATVPAAAAGGIAGKSLQDTLENYLYGTGPKSYKEQAHGLIEAGKDSAMAEMGGQVLGKVPGLIRSGVNSVKGSIADRVGANLDYTPIANKEAVEKAGQALDLNIPKGVLTDNPTYQKLESGLSQSGSLPAREVRTQYNDFYKGLDKASSKIADLKTTNSDFAIGKSIQEDLTNQVNASKKPVSEMYNSLSKDLKKIPVDEGVVNRAFGDLKRNPLFQTKDGIELLNEYKSAALSQPELLSLKEFRSTLGDSIGPSASPLDAKRMDAIRDVVTTIRDNSINVTKSSMPKAMHKEVDNLIDQMALADKAHASHLEDINSIRGIVGGKEIGSPTTFLNKLADSKEADLAQRASNLDVTSMRSLQEKYPSVFEKAKAAKVNDMIQSATSPVSGFNESRFLKQYDSLSKEMKDLVYAPEMQAHIENVKTIKQAIPDKLGPSGTPEGMMTMDMLSPKRNAIDYGIKKTLESVTSPAIEKPAMRSMNLGAVSPHESSRPRNTGNVLQLMPRQATPATQAPASLPRAADKKDEATAPTKGPGKWASDGYDKLLEHASLVDEKIPSKEALLKNPKLKQLLISASDLKPGSKAIDKLLQDVLKLND